MTEFEVGKKYTVERVLSEYQPWPKYILCTVADNDTVGILKFRFCTDNGKDFGWFNDAGECPITKGIAAKITGEYKGE